MERFRRLARLEISALTAFANSTADTSGGQDRGGKYHTSATSAHRVMR